MNDLPIKLISLKIRQSRQMEIFQNVIQLILSIYPVQKQFGKLDHGHQIQLK